MSKPEKIKCSMASPVWRDVDVVTRGPAVQSKMPGNPNFRPPDLTGEFRDVNEIRMSQK